MGNSSTLFNIVVFRANVLANVLTNNTKQHRKIDNSISVNN